MKGAGAYVLRIVVGFLFFTVFFTSCNKEGEELSAEVGEELSGGQATVFEIDNKIFDKAAPNLSSENFTRFQVGNSFFRSSWVAAPSSATARDGLGPLMNSISCTGCHIRDGRGAPPAQPGDQLISMLLRLSVAGQSEFGGPVPDPVYGTQLQTMAINKVLSEGEVEILYEELKGYFADGSSYSLRKPTYVLKNLNYGPASADIQISPRVAPFMIGLGLLDAIAEQDILSQADPFDANKDGVSGKPNFVWDYEKGKKTLGKWGWKANQPTLRQQTAGAFLGDLGLTTSLFSGQNCTSAQQNCLDMPNGGEPEITDEMLDFTTAYTASLGVPVRRNYDDPEVLQGKKLFMKVGCAACHTPKYVTRGRKDFPEFAGQVIRPYTDLLLHDMGAELADNRPDFEATGQEWRTPPLWGIGLIPLVNDHTNYLHDGRARNLTEAILWHSGEGEKAKQAFVEMNKEDRAALIKFLESL